MRKLLFSSIFTALAVLASPLALADVTGSPALVSALYEEATLQPLPAESPALEVTALDALPAPVTGSDYLQTHSQPSAVEYGYGDHGAHRYTARLSEVSQPEIVRRE